MQKKRSFLAGGSDFQIFEPTKQASICLVTGSCSVRPYVCEAVVSHAMDVQESAIYIYMWIYVEGLLHGFPHTSCNCTPKPYPNH